MQYKLFITYMEFIIILFLLVLNGVFAMYEIALVSSSKARLETLAGKGNKRAKRFDPQADDTSRDNLMRQSIDLISKFPTIIAYAYNMLRHATYGRSLHIRHPREKLSIAENFLYMLKKDYTELDARTLDLLLVLQAEHGGFVAGGGSLRWLRWASIPKHPIVCMPSLCLMPPTWLFPV